MAIDKELLSILVCPLTKVSLKLMPREGVLAINELVVEGRLKFSDGSLVEDSMDEVLMTVDSHSLYMVVQGIPMMLVDRRIQTDQLRGIIDLEF